MVRSGRTLSRPYVRCESSQNHPDIRILSCTRNIQSGRFNGKNLAVAFANRAQAYRVKRLWDEALSDFDDAIHLHPEFGSAFNNRGNIYYFKGQFDRAIEDFNEAIRLNPDFAEAYGNRGNVYRKINQYDRAIEDYNAALKKNPTDAQVFADRGLTYEKKGLKTEALRDFNKAFDLGFRHSLLLRKIRDLGEFL